MTSGTLVPAMGRPGVRDAHASGRDRRQQNRGARMAKPETRVSIAAPGRMVGIGDPSTAAARGEVEMRERTVHSDGHDRSRRGRFQTLDLGPLGGVPEEALTADITAEDCEAPRWLTEHGHEGLIGERVYLDGRNWEFQGRRGD